MQVADEFGAEHFARGLARMTHMQRVSKQPLTAEQLALAVQMANNLAELHPPGRANLSVPINLPDTQGLMANINALHFNDAEWLANNPDNAQRLVHADIAIAVAQQLGVSSLRYHAQVCYLPARFFFNSLVP